MVEETRSQRLHFFSQIEAGPGFAFNSVILRLKPGRKRLSCLCLFDGLRPGFAFKLVFSAPEPGPNAIRFLDRSRGGAGFLIAKKRRNQGLVLIHTQPATLFTVC